MANLISKIRLNLFFPIWPRYLRTEDEKFFSGFSRNLNCLSNAFFGSDSSDKQKIIAMLIGKRNIGKINAVVNRCKPVDIRGWDSLRVADRNIMLVGACKHAKNFRAPRIDRVMKGIHRWNVSYGISKW